MSGSRSWRNEDLADFLKTQVFRTVLVCEMMREKEKVKVKEKGTMRVANEVSA